MNNTYENINTFSDDIYKSDLREKILNPLIVQHNSMGLDLYNNHARIKALEEGGVGGGVSNFKDLADVPAYEANKFLKVNTAGDLEWGAIATGENGGAVDDSRITAAEEDILALESLTANHGTKLTTYKAKIDDNTARIIDLENGSGGAGEGGGSYDDTALVAAVDALKVETADHEDRITALEVSGGNGTVDLSPVTDRLDVIEVDLEAATSELSTATNNIITLQGESSDHETRIADLENAPGGGGSVDAAGLFALMEGGQGVSVAMNSGNDKVVLSADVDNHPVDAAQVVYSWNADHLPGGGANKAVSKESMTGSSFFISATSDASATVTFNLPDIVDHGTTAGAAQVEGGRLFFFGNTGASDFTLVADNVSIVSGQGQVEKNFVVPAGRSAQVMAVVRPTGGYKNYHVLLCGSASM